MFLPKVIPIAMLKTLEASLSELRASYQPFVCKRAITRGEQHALAVYHFGWWKFYTKVPSLIRDTATIAGQKFLAANVELWKLVDKLFHYYFPSIAACHSRVEKGLISQLQSFSSLVVNVEMQSIPHRDYGEAVDGMAAVFNLGDYSGGELYLHEPKVAITSYPCDLSLINSFKITHSSLQIFAGKKTSFVLFSHQNMLNFYNVQ